MQKITRTIFSLLVLATYIVASIGFGVHECSARGTKHVLIINRDKPCAEIHQSCSCSSESCTVDKHSKNCCSTETYHLDLDYEISQPSYGSFFFFNPLSIYSQNIQSTISNLMAPHINVDFEVKHGPPIYLNTNKLLATLAQWRL